MPGPPLTFEQEQARQEAQEKMDRRRVAEAGSGEAHDAEAPPRAETRQELVLTRIRLPFSDVLLLAIQFGLAAIPAAIIFSFVWGVVSKALL